MNKTDWNLSSLVERGGVHYNICGTGPKELIEALIKLLPPFPVLDNKNLLDEILLRETLVSTGIGHGIALPHPRSPMIENDFPMVSIAFPALPLNWNSLDGGKVHTVFLILSSSSKQHLGTLSKINFLCQQEKFYSLIESRASKSEIIKAIKNAEKDWEK